MNTEPLILRETGIRYLQASGHNIFTNQSIHKTVFICVSVLRHHIQYVFLDYFEHQNHQLKSRIHEKKKVPLNRLQKKKTKTHILQVYSLKAKARRQSVILFDFRWEHMHWVTQIFSCSVHVLE